MEASERRELIVSVAHGDDGMALVTVADTGPGVDPAVAERLFEPFLTTKSSGLGVGLSICRTIVEAHGGRIWADRNRLGGATFCFTLPLAEAEATIGD
jgi:two-component system sensor kinase FixL